MCLHFIGQAGNYGEFAQPHPPRWWNSWYLDLPWKPGAAFCFKTPSPDPRSGPIALLSQSPDSCTAILHTSLTDQKKNKKNWPIGNLNTEIHPFVRRLKTGGIKKKKSKRVRLDAASAGCCVDLMGVLWSDRFIDSRGETGRRRGKKNGKDNAFYISSLKKWIIGRRGCRIDLIIITGSVIAIWDSPLAADISGIHSLSC